MKLNDFGIVLIVAAFALISLSYGAHKLGESHPEMASCLEVVEDAMEAETDLLLQLPFGTTEKMIDLADLMD